MIAELSLSPEEVESVVRAHLIAKCEAFGLPPNVEVIPGGLWSNWKAVCRDDAEHQQHLQCLADLAKRMSDLSPSTVITEPDFTVIASIPAR